MGMARQTFSARLTGPQGLGTPSRHPAKSAAKAGAREAFDAELRELRESLLRLATLVESQIQAALSALRKRDRSDADAVRAADQELNEIFRQIRERSFLVIAT